MIFATLRDYSAFLFYGLTMRFVLTLFVMLFVILSLASNAFAKDRGQNTLRAPSYKAGPVAMHGQLSTVGSKIVGQHGKAVSLAGPSFFWSNTGWGQEPFYNAGAVQSFAKEWNAGIVRVALGAEGDGSLLYDPAGNMARAETVIQAAIANNIYVVVDFHSHQAERNIAQAQDTFRYLARKYGHIPHIIYEIYNEPTNEQDWSRVIKPYSELMINTIREIDPDNLIIVGTQTWSQDVDKAALDPIAGHGNLVYALHFYAGTHKGSLRTRAQNAINVGLPVIVSEWGMVDYTGDGPIDRASTEEWLSFIKRNQLSHMIWAASSKEEGASMFTPAAPKTGGWRAEHLTPTGHYAKEIISNWNKRPVLRPRRPSSTKLSTYF